MNNYHDIYDTCKRRKMTTMLFDMVDDQQSNQGLASSYSESILELVRWVFVSTY